MFRATSVLILLALGIFAPTAQAQEPGAPEEPERFLINFALESEVSSYPAINASEMLSVALTVRDMSRDDSSTVPGAPSARAFGHRTTLEREIVAGDENGWLVSTMPQFTTYAGEEQTETFQVQALPTVKEPYMELLIKATMLDPRSGVEVNNTIKLAFVTNGNPTFFATPRGSMELAPGQLSTMGVQITHGGLLPRTFDARIVENPCGVQVVPFPTTTLQEKGSRLVEFSVKGPEEKAWYVTEDCSVTLEVFPIDDPDRSSRIPLSIVVNGGYIDPVWVFWALAAVTAIILIIFFLARRKAAIEEELLGKPQRPWTIPVERVYLEHLEARDPRAAYVVRHFLMEEEYRSALLWYKSYKGATKGTRAKERIVVGQEKKYERFRNKWQKKIARPQKKADRFDAKLQKKLDRRGKKGVRKERRKWKKQVAKLEKAFENKHEKAVKKWEKAAKKAEKKGEPVPEKPERGAPDLPPEPSMNRIMLADHKWNKKSQRFRKKMIKKEGNLEVKFEKKDAKMLRKVERKVQKVARKLDDPEFASEHPLVGKQA